MRSVKSISGLKCSQGSPASCHMSCIATFPRGDLGFTLWRDVTAHPVFRPSPNRGDPSDPRRPLVVTWRREVGLPGPQRQPGAQHGPATFHRHDLPERKALPVPQGTVAPETGNIFAFCQTVALRKHEEHEHAFIALDIMELRRMTEFKQVWLQLAPANGAFRPSMFFSRRCLSLIRFDSIFKTALSFEMRSG